MKKQVRLLLFLLLTLTFTSSLFGQGFEDKRSPQVFAIQYKRIAINEFKNYDSVLVENGEDFLRQSTDNGPTLTGFFRSDTLVKIIELIGLSNKVIETEYYLENNKIFFICVTERKYKFDKKTQTFDLTKFESSFRRSYYFENGKLFDTDVKDKTFLATKQKDSLLFLENCNKYSLLLKSKKK
jgi:hypothetical protein